MTETRHEQSAENPSIASNDDAILPSTLDFPVVGIGASAGGIAALIRLFENMPPINDMAFVVVLHLAPKHESAADQILQRVTNLPVTKVSDTVPIQKQHVYVIAPNSKLQMSDGCLTVSQLERPYGRHTAIDIFFRTLANAHRERSIAIVLSGTGSDGVQGLATVKEQGGVTIAQEPADAAHDGMPQAAIDAGVIDFVLPADAIAQKLLDLWSNARCIQMPPLGGGENDRTLPVSPQALPAAEEALQVIIARLFIHTGHDFRHYKRAAVLRRIERRMQVCGVPTLIEYCSALEERPNEYENLLKDLLIGVTSFFRDPDAFALLEQEIIPPMFRQRNEEIRAWVPACATGEEAYSIAMLLAERAALQSSAQSIQVFASDIDVNAIATARKGIYPASIIADVPPERLREHFTKREHRYQIRKSIRDLILFVPHNLLRDPPFSKLDLVSCRNLLIYLNRETQTQVLEMFHFALKSDGVLLLGNSETSSLVNEYFLPIDKKQRLYRPKPLRRNARFVPVPVPVPVPRLVPQLPSLKSVELPALSYADIHQHALLKCGSVSILIDADLNILHLSERASNYLRFTSGVPSRSVLALVLPELRLELRSVLQLARDQQVMVETPRVLLERNAEVQEVICRVHPFSEANTDADLLLIVINEFPVPAGVAPEPTRMEASAVRRIESELRQNEEKLQETLEHAELSTEQLRVAYEKLQAINEELRSATEELETSKEELQSVNEELITVNYELKVKVDETSKAKDDLDNLIIATDIATVFVDRALRIKRYTPRARDVFQIIPTDLGRPLSDLSHGLDYDDLVADALSALDNLAPVEREVRSQTGRYYIVRFLPYRTNDDRIDGVVLTFFDITERRDAEDRVRVGEQRMRLVADSTRDYAIITLDTEGRFTSWNKGAEFTFGWSENEVLGQPSALIFTPEDRAQGMPEDEMERALRDGRAEDERWHIRKDGSRFYCSGVMTPLRDVGFYGFAKIARDQTARIRQESQREAELNLEQIGRSNAESSNALKDEFLAILSHELRHPLNMIHINVELLSRLPIIQESAVCKKATTVIRTSVLSQAKIIEDLLDLSRLNTGKLTLTKTLLDLAAFVNSIADVTREDPAAHGLTIVTEGTNQPVFVLADAVRLEQVILNLLGNALKFTPPGGTVTLRMRIENDECRLDIIDTGQGIAAHLLPYIFDMFSTYGSVTKRNKKGLGIGLALVQQITELHNGRVQATSEGKGKGSCFSIWLPLPKNARLQDSGGQSALENNIAGLRMLIVDDAEDMIDAFKSLLELEGASVFIAKRANEGLKILDTHEIDLLISDISMPDMDGYEFIEQVRQRNLSLPAIAVSGLGREQDVEQSYKSGFSAHINKPVSLEALTRTIALLLEANEERDIP